MKIEVLLFAQLKEVYGADRIMMEVADGARVREAVETIMSHAPFEQYKHLPLRYAVNEEFKTAHNRLSPYDRLALLSPVAGG